jgi:hypothetical protein
MASKENISAIGGERRAKFKEEDVLHRHADVTAEKIALQLAMQSAVQVAVIARPKEKPEFI